MHVMRVLALVATRGGNYVRVTESGHAQQPSQVEYLYVPNDPCDEANAHELLHDAPTTRGAVAATRRQRNRRACSIL